ncbi:AzlD domain-containing protein [Alcaligenes sp. Lyrl_28]|uniref:AzlD domain-containing protein n=1 Tax=Alcaligenes sp. Lyrl_28 TaxID=3110924 RepID=UPI003F7BFB38
MDWSFLLMVVLAGLGTFLIRYLPLRLGGRQPKADPSRISIWPRLFGAIGPAGVVSLLVVSLISLLRPDQLALDLPPLLAGLAGVLLGRRWPGGIAGSTLLGVVAYGLCTAYVGV